MPTNKNDKHIILFLDRTIMLDHPSSLHAIKLGEQAYSLIDETNKEVYESPLKRRSDGSYELTNFNSGKSAFLNEIKENAYALRLEENEEPFMILSSLVKSQLDTHLKQYSELGYLEFNKEMLPLSNKKISVSRYIRLKDYGGKHTLQLISDQRIKAEFPIIELNENQITITDIHSENPETLIRLYDVAFLSEKPTEKTESTIKNFESYKAYKTEYLNKKEESINFNLNSYLKTRAVALPSIKDWKDLIHDLYSAENNQIAKIFLSSITVIPKPYRTSVLEYLMITGQKQKAGTILKKGRTNKEWLSELFLWMSDYKMSGPLELISYLLQKSLKDSFYTLPSLSVQGDKYRLAYYDGKFQNKGTITIDDGTEDWITTFYLQLQNFLFGQIHKTNNYSKLASYAQCLFKDENLYLPSIKPRAIESLQQLKNQEIRYNFLDGETDESWHDLD